MLRTTLLLVLAALTCYADSDYENEGRLYRSIIVGDYDAAVLLSKSYRGTIIKNVIEKLIDDSHRNVLDYGIALWNNGSQDIVRNYFPIEIRSIVGQHSIKLIGKRDNMVLKLGVKIDSDGDRTAYGDSNHVIGDRMAWKFIPVLGPKVYFHIYNPHTNQYLKLGGSRDSYGDYQAYGSFRYNSFKHQFYLEPVKHEDQLLFYIINREYPQALKYSRAVDSYGDRWVYGENGRVTGEPVSFGWIVEPY